MVEFAIIAVVAIMLMVVGIQYAIIGQASLAVSQGASALARYAAVNSSVTPALGTYNGTGSLPAGAARLISPTLCPGGTCPSALTVTVASYTGTTTTTTNTPKGTADRLVVTVNYDATSKIALPNPFLGISFPTTLTASDSQMYE